MARKSKEEILQERKRWEELNKDTLERVDQQVAILQAHVRYMSTKRLVQYSKEISAFYTAGGIRDCEHRLEVSLDQLIRERRDVYNDADADRIEKDIVGLLVFLRVQRQGRIEHEAVLDSIREDKLKADEAASEKSIYEAAAKLASEEVRASTDKKNLETLGAQETLEVDGPNGKIKFNINYRVAEPTKRVDEEVYRTPSYLNPFQRVKHLLKSHPGHAFGIEKIVEYTSLEAKVARRNLEKMRNIGWVTWDGRYYRWGTIK